MGFTVDPAELDGVASRAERAGQGMTAPVRGLTEDLAAAADRIVYQRAASLVEAVGQKGGSAMTEAAASVSAVGWGLRSAAAVYRASDAARTPR